MPSLRATALRRRRLSPVSMTMRTPSACSARIASGRADLDRIGHAEQPGGLPSIATNIDGLTVRAAAPRRASARSAASIAALAPSARGCRPRRARPSTRPVTPSPVHRREVFDGIERRDAARLGAAHDRRRQRMLARALERSPRARSTSASVERRRAQRHRRQLGLALRQRAGLVDDERVDRARALDRLGVPEQHADRARRAPSPP